MSLHLHCVDELAHGMKHPSFTSVFGSQSDNPLMAILLGLSARYCNVASSTPSRIMRWMTMSALNTIVHVESISRYCSVRNTSPTPASPVCVANRMCSMYLDLGAASYA